MASSIAHITSNFSKFSRHYKEYLRLQGKEEYDPKKFEWFRPEKVTDTTDLDQISDPYETEEIDELARKLVDDASITNVNVGDYGVVMFQHDAVVSACRSFAGRHKSKLRHFAHADGISERLGNEYGTIHYCYDKSLENLLTQAKMAK